MGTSTAADLQALANAVRSSDTTIEDFIETLDLDEEVSNKMFLEVLEIDAALQAPKDSPLPTIVAGRWA